MPLDTYLQRSSNRPNSKEIWVVDFNRVHAIAVADYTYNRQFNELSTVVSSRSYSIVDFIYIHTYMYINKEDIYICMYYILNTCTLLIQPSDILHVYI